MHEIRGFSVTLHVSDGDEDIDERPVIVAVKDDNVETPTLVSGVYGEFCTLVPYALEMHYTAVAEGQVAVEVPEWDGDEITLLALDIDEAEEVSDE